MKIERQAGGEMVAFFANKKKIQTIGECSAVITKRSLKAVASDKSERKFASSEKKRLKLKCLIHSTVIIFN